MNICEEFVNVYKEIQDENLINDLHESIARYDSIISYKDKLYYKGKIVENMMLEQVHHTNYDFLVNRDNLRRDKDFDENEGPPYENNFCNNICLYFSSLCNFCLIMQLYYSLNKTRNTNTTTKRDRSSDTTTTTTHDGTLVVKENKPTFKCFSCYSRHDVEVGCLERNITFCCVKKEESIDAQPESKGSDP
jgi:hypothetical protein